MFYTPVRGRVPAQGMLGGRDGTLDVPLWRGNPLPPDSEFFRDGWVMFRDDADELTFHAPSGAGFGDPRRRDPEAIEVDIRRGLMSREGAARDYGYQAPP
jgi:N-methylhydantoinase B